MKKILYIVILLFTSIHTFAQDAYFFNKLYADSIYVKNPTVASLKLADGYFNLGLSANQTEGNFYLRKIDKNGNELWSKTYQGNKAGKSMFISSALISTNDKHYAFVGNTETYQYSNDWRIVFCKFDENGDTIFLKQYELGYEIASNGLTQTQDGGYFIYGLQIVNNVRSMYVLKVNTLGIKEWDKAYVTTTDAVAFCGLQTQDGGYIVSGWDKNANDDYDMYVIKTDSIGDTLWTRHFGGNDNDIAAQVTLLANGGILVNGGIREDGILKHYIAYLKSNGLKIWSKKLVLAGYTNLIAPLLLVKDGYICAGSYADDVFSPPKSVIVKFNAVGDTLWTRTLPVPFPDQDCYTRDIDVCEDGGFLLTGFTYGSSQNSWVVKTDSMGYTCSFLGCDSTVIDTTAVSIGNIIYPPQVNTTLPIGISMVKVYDITGRLLLSTPYTMPNAAMATLPNGIYIKVLQNKSGKTLSRQKLVLFR